MSDDGFVADGQNNIYEIFGQNKPIHYNKHNIRNYVYGDYADYFTILFNREKYNKITIEINSYDLLGYKGFFATGWLFSF